MFVILNIFDGLLIMQKLKYINLKCFSSDSKSQIKSHTAQRPKSSQLKPKVLESNALQGYLVSNDLFKF